MRSRTLLISVAAYAMVAAACTGGEAELTTTTSLISATTETTEQETTTTESPAPTTSTTLVGESVANHQVVARISTDDGEILHIVVPPGAYTDRDLINFIGDLKEADPDLWGAEVFDDPAGPEALAVPDGERTEEQAQVLADHHFITLTEGNQVIFRGPFSEFGEFILGS